MCNVSTTCARGKADGVNDAVDSDIKLGSDYDVEPSAPYLRTSGCKCGAWLVVVSLELRHDGHVSVSNSSPAWWTAQLNFDENRNSVKFQRNSTHNGQSSSFYTE